MFPIKLIVKMLPPAEIFSGEETLTATRILSFQPEV
jgi:hypothetical protein